MRETISAEIKDNLTKRAKDFNIALDDVSIINLGFMKEYS
jgi:prohibitin 2